MSLPAGHDQAAHRLRLEWGPTGARLVPADLAVVVDVLSFTTALSVAIDRDLSVYPFRWRDERAAAYAEERGATLAVGRSAAAGDPAAVSLSPASLRRVEGVRRLVLPSPNGSTIATILAEQGAEVVAGCLRNASAVGAVVAERLARGGSVTVIAAGERWPDGSLRPAVEDLWGAGAVVAAALAQGVAEADPSPEARAAAAAFAAVGAALPLALHDCAGGRELDAIGFADDVDVAAEFDASARVPTLRDEAFVSR